MMRFIESTTCLLKQTDVLNEYFSYRNTASLPYLVKFSLTMFLPEGGV